MQKNKWVETTKRIVLLSSTFAVFLKHPVYCDLSMMLLRLFNFERKCIFWSGKTQSLISIVSFLLVSYYWSNFILSAKISAHYFSTYETTIAPIDRSRILKNSLTHFTPPQSKAEQVTQLEISKFKRTTHLLLYKATLEGLYARSVAISRAIYISQRNRVRHYKNQSRFML